MLVGLKPDSILGLLHLKYSTPISPNRAPKGKKEAEDKLIKRAIASAFYYVPDIIIILNY